MTIKKKGFIGMLSCLLAAVILTACAPQSPAQTQTRDTEPAPTVEIDWERNARAHWYLDENGEQAGFEQHSLTDVVCDICGSEVWLYEDGTADVYNYSEALEMLRMTSYDADGSVRSDIVYEYEYDAVGNKTREQQYYNGALAEEVEYAVNEAGECLPVKQTDFYDDGTWAVNEYDGYGNMVKAVSYDADGNVVTQIFSQYAESTDGGRFEVSTTIIYQDGTKTVMEYNEHGDTLSIRQCDENDNVLSQLSHQYEYDAAGNKIHSWFYDNGKLLSESEYALNAEGWSYSFRDTEYNDDGTKTVYEYDEYGELVSQTLYDAQGNVIPEK